MSALRLCDWCEKEMPRNQGGYVFVSRQFPHFPLGVRFVRLANLHLCFECNAARVLARDAHPREQLGTPVETEVKNA